jgi:GT2 family glycosyltransferase/glycosyltransferase involved in cell wall biosynthesis
LERFSEYGNGVIPLQLNTSSSLTVAAFTLETWQHSLAILRLVEPMRMAGVRLLKGVDEAGLHADFISEADLVVIQRDFPRNKESYETVIRRARQEGKPVVYEIDDLLFALPNDHPDISTNVYTSALLPMLSALIEADAATVSTPALKDALGHINPRIWVLPNYLNDQYWSLTQRVVKLPPVPVVIGYMGSDTHKPDLDDIAPVIVRLLGRYGNAIRFRFWGGEPPQAIRDHPNVEWIPLAIWNYADFAAYFARQESDIFIAPLSDNLFNRCKSPLKFLEYSSLGVPGVYSKITPYQEVIQNNENGLLASDHQEWEDCLVQLIENEDLRQQMGLKALHTVQQIWLLSSHTQEWQQTYQGILANFQRSISATDGSTLVQNQWSIQSKSYTRGLLNDIGKMPNPPKASIIILSYNNLEYLRMCLESIYIKTSLPFEAIVVDNASQDITVKYLQDLASKKSNLKILLNDTNQGFARGNNQGAQLARGEYLIFLNDDTVVTQDWLEKILWYLHDPAIGMVGPVTNAAANESRVAVTYQNMAEMEVFADRYTTQNRGKVFEISVLAWFCLGMRRTIYDEIGPLDERFEVGMFEDDDYALRVKQAGYKILCAEDVFIHHWGSASFSKLQIPYYWQLFSANRKKYEDKWGVQWQPHTNRPELIRQQYKEMIENAQWHATLLTEREVEVNRLKQEQTEKDQELGRSQEEINKQKQDFLALEQSYLALEQNFSAREQNYSALVQNYSTLEQNYSTMEQDLGCLRQEVNNKSQEIAERTDEISSLNQQLLENQSALHVVESRLQEIYGSNAWKLIIGIWTIRLLIAPTGSRREIYWKKSIHAIKTLLKLPGRIFRGTKTRLKRLPGKRASLFSRFFISWYAFTFKRYKQARNSNFSNPRYLNCPSVKGLVSIVLPVYNGAKYLSEALDSILQQSYPNFELIVIDDGSTDETPQILEGYSLQDSRIHIIKQDNQKLPRSLSNGFRVAKGEFLTWTSDDNRLKPDCLEKLVGCLQRHPEWDMVYANEDIIDENGKPLVKSDWFLHYQDPPESHHVKLPQDPSELNTYPNNYLGAAFMYRDRVYYLLGDYSPYRHGLEDYDYWLRVNGLLNLQHVDFKEQVYEYRFHSKSLTSQDETLGITKQRNRLMAYEDARRDFYMAPMLWEINATENPSAQKLLHGINQWITETNQILCKKLDQTNSARFWHPMVYISIVEQPTISAAPPTDCPSMAWKVLIVTGDAPLPTVVDPAWDVCITTAEAQTFPHLDRPHQGWLAMSDSSTLFSSVDIQARSAHLTSLEAEIENPTKPRLKVTVVICTYHRERLLMDAMQSVARQSFPPENYELIVVNNDPNDLSVAAMVEELRSAEFKDRPEHLRLINCPFKGLSFARNAGISEAQGGIICFLDDDAQAQPDWLDEISVTFEQYPHAGVTGGRIDLVVPQPRPRGLKKGWEKFWSHFQPGYSQSTCVKYWWEFPWGANWCAQRDALLKIGGFRTRYGRKGEDFGGGEELVAALLIQQVGYEIYINPLARVSHTPDSSRFTFRHVWKTIQTSKRNQYLQQVDLYAPMELSLRNQVRNILSNIKHIVWVRKSPWQERLEYLLYAQINTLLLFKLSGDYVRRSRIIN